MEVIVNQLGKKLAYVAFLALAVASTAMAGTQLDAGKASPSKHVTHAGNGGG
jgi:tripartite-type tricarboxylate transporter receptor subunit TctC